MHVIYFVIEYKVMVAQLEEIVDTYEEGIGY